MQKYDFDKIIDRKGTGAVKTDDLERRFGKSDLIPLWVADMDFETPPFIIEAMRRRLDNPIFGYTLPDQDYISSIVDWIRDHHNWEVRPEWITYVPGVVKGIGMAINALLDKGDKVIIQPPVYHPFRLVPQGNGYEVVCNPLKENADGTYSMDFDNLESVCDDRCKLLILSNPHNPAGIVWDRDTLVRLALFCCKRNITVISDEIHCDMALWGNRHIPFAASCPEAASCSITFAAPSKTFNIAGIVSSYSVVPDRKLRNRFYKYLKANDYDAAPIFPVIATISAFRNGEQWRRQMIEYVENNVEAVIRFCRTEIPLIKPVRPQASFLVWLDCRGLGLSQEELVNLFVCDAGLALNDGEMFGLQGRGFMRMNVGAPYSVISESLCRLRDAVNKLGK